MIPFSVLKSSVYAQQNIIRTRNHELTQWEHQRRTPAHLDDVDQYLHMMQQYKKSKSSQKAALKQTKVERAQKSKYAIYKRKLEREKKDLVLDHKYQIKRQLGENDNKLTVQKTQFEDKTMRQLKLHNKSLNDMRQRLSRSVSHRKKIERKLGQIETMIKIKKKTFDNVIREGINKTRIADLDHNKKIRDKLNKINALRKTVSEQEATEQSLNETIKGLNTTLDEKMAKLNNVQRITSDQRQQIYDLDKANKLGYKRYAEVDHVKTKLKKTIGSLKLRIGDLKQLNKTLERDIKDLLVVGSKTLLEYGENGDIESVQNKYMKFVDSNFKKYYD